MELVAHSSLAWDHGWKEVQKTNFSLVRAESVGQTVMFLYSDRDLSDLMHFDRDLTNLTG